MIKTDQGLGQVDLFDNDDIDLLSEISGQDGWPDHREFPYNARRHSVETIIHKDLLGSKEVLIVTGYASLEKIIEYCSHDDNKNQRIDLLFGTEPTNSGPRELSLVKTQFNDEIRRYWLEKGISILLSGNLIRLIEGLKSGFIQARYIDSTAHRLHAKIYVGDAGITIGSSNFSNNGLSRQMEANVRFTPKEKRRFNDSKKLAQRFWEMGVDYAPDLILLLEQLLQVVSWDESLARACAEVLEGDWARKYLDMQVLPGDLPLWPSQKQGIAQALWLLESVGSVLIADATGAGKTRMGAYLVRAAVDRIWSMGRVRKGKTLLICPPSVQKVWNRESQACQLPIDVYSQGILSRKSSDGGQEVLSALRRTQVLAIDEAHNFLNVQSNRTKMLLGNMADHVILFTATPINKGPRDLLRLVDMLGADNLDDKTLEMFSSLFIRRAQLNRGLSEHEIAHLRKQIQQFTVRRTKTQLNDLVDLAPHEYRSKSGKLCRYPRHLSRCYPLNESDDDCKLARKIRSLADQLYGVAFIQSSIEMPDVLRREGWTDQKYLESRLLAAKKLAGYQVMACLRSSRAALIEHIEGTLSALAHAGLDSDKKKGRSGNLVQKIKDRAGKPPGNLLGAEGPEWLTDVEEHQAISQGELSKYQQIAQLVKQMSGGREDAKADHLIKLANRHELSIAFDSKPLTLAVLQKKLRQRDERYKVLVATGETKKDRLLVQRSFDHGSSAKHLIALCSDSMSEGINLQQASVVTHLDMPTVVRIAEQRVGRVDRMDSPHQKIEAWWPDDAPDFCLTTDDRFIERFETVDVLLGSNMPLPPEIRLQKQSAVSAQAMINEYEQSIRKDKIWDDIHDAFQPVRELVRGDHKIVSEETYAFYQHEKTRVVSRVSLVKADKPWAFFCIAGSAFGAPRWVFMSDESSRPAVLLTEVSEHLRSLLGSDTVSTTLDQHATRQLNGFVDRLADSERELLPKRKQRALDEMEKIIDAYHRDASDAQRQNECDLYGQLLRVLRMEDKSAVPDWDAMADRWLDVIRPVWYAKLIEPKRTRPLLLKDIRQELINNKIDFQMILAQFSKLPPVKSMKERVVAVIIGVA